MQMSRLSKVCPRRLFTKIHINATANPDVSLACVEANLSNGQSVDQKGVSWATAVIAGMALVASAVTSGLGHSNTAAHVASNALSLFGYFQAQAIVGLTAVPLPPIVQSWTQNFQWTMGIIRVGFMQTIATWYQKSTGGTPGTLLNSLTTTSVQVLKKRSTSTELNKRSVDETIKLLTHAHNLSKRATETSSGTYVVKGIKRVAFRAGIEATNLFLTGFAFFWNLCRQGYQESGLPCRYRSNQPLPDWFCFLLHFHLLHYHFRLLVQGFLRTCDSIEMDEERQVRGFPQWLVHCPEGYHVSNGSYWLPPDDYSMLVGIYPGRFSR